MIRNSSPRLRVGSGRWTISAKPPESVRSAEDAAVVVTTLFAEMGFDPELESLTARTRIRLHACPFESVARQNPSVVCSLHLGLIRGVLTRLGARQIKSTLTPWDTVHTCLAQLERQ